MTLVPPDLTDFHCAIASAHGISLYDHYSEQQAANVLGLSLISLRRLRSTQRIGALKLSPRKTAFFGYQLVDYLLASIEQPRSSDTAPLKADEFPDQNAVLRSGSSNSKRPKKAEILDSALRTLQAK